MSAFSKRSNYALDANPNSFNFYQTADISIDTNGSNWYWAVTAIMFASTLAFIGLSFTVPRRNRIFHYITAAITMTASIAYFSLASNLGFTPIPVEFVRGGGFTSVIDGGSGLGVPTRAIFYVRYIDWFVTTPLLLLDILLTCGMPWPTILATIFLDIVMIITGLVGALVSSSYKWGYFVFAMFALFGIAYNVLAVGLPHATVLGGDVRRTFLTCGAWTLFLWFLYPIAWGLAEGGNVIGADGEGVFYGILDILAKPVFGALLIWGHRNIDPAVLGLQIRDYADDTVRHEKTAHGPAGGPVAGPSTTTGTTGTTAPVTHTGNTAPVTTAGNTV